MSSFNFKGADQQKKLGQLSGGERNRVHLARMLKSGANVLLLDEPTNDLDVDTLRALEEALLEFAGCVVVISHDRWFLDRIATHMLAFEGDSEVVWFEGNYQPTSRSQTPPRRGGISAAQDPLPQARARLKRRRAASFVLRCCACPANLCGVESLDCAGPRSVVTSRKPLRSPHPMQDEPLREFPRPLSTSRALGGAWTPCAGRSPRTSAARRRGFQ